MFELKKDEIIGDCRKLHNEEYHDLYSSPNIITMIKSRKVRWAVHGKKRNMCSIWVVKPEGKRSIGRHRCSWKNNVKMDLTEIGLSGMGWINPVRDRDQWKSVVNTVMNFWVPCM
jgi:hypothetical protein